MSKKRYQVPERRPRSSPITDPVPGSVLARNTNPSTSHAAAWMNPGRRSGQRFRLAVEFLFIYPDAMNWEAVHRITGIRGAWKRISELKERGMLEVGGTAVTTMGAEAQTYRLTEDGRDEMVRLVKGEDHAKAG